MRNYCGQYETLRALLDPGSQESFITAAAADSLALDKKPNHTRVTGIAGASAGRINSLVELSFTAHIPSDQEFRVHALVLPKLTSKLPCTPIRTSSVPELPLNMPLADPTFDIPGPIDLLLGADLFAAIVKKGFHKFNDN